MVVLVTGSSRGIGAATILEFAKKGYDVVINYNNSKESAYKLQEKVKKYNVRCLAIKCDISNEDEVKEMISKIITTFGTIDILVNNASIAQDCPFEDKTVASFRKTLSVNLIGTFIVSRLVGDIMYNKKKGQIINIASTNGIDTTYVESCDYDASKAGVISLTHNLAKYYAPYVRVNAIAPGWVDTDMNKSLDKSFVNNELDKILLSRFATPEEIAESIYHISECSYINDSIIRVDGGERP